VRYPAIAGNRRENLRLGLSDPQTEYNGHQYPCECLKLLRRFPYVDGKHAVRLLGGDVEHTAHRSGPLGLEGLNDLLVLVPLDPLEFNYHRYWVVTQFEK